MTSRYTGKPFLRLLDNYVMDAIGMLDADTDAALTAEEPQFHKLFATTGSWREIVVSRMNFPAGIAGAIREVWEKGRVQYIAAQGVEPNPWEFTIHFIDTKFPH